MLVIDVPFFRFDEINLQALLGMVGVYAIWDTGVGDAPTYMGEGLLLDRIAKHVKRWDSMMTGLVAPMNASDLSWAKEHARIAEAFFLDLGELLDREPEENDAPGHTSLLREAIEANNCVRVNVTGWHPLTSPAESRSRLARRTELKVEIDGDGDLLYSTPWNKRATR